VSVILNWVRRSRVSVDYEPEASAEPEQPQRRVTSGKYLLLFKYLAGRYANTVVLTFAEIEDLIGSSLPDEARLRPTWWTNPETSAAGPSYSDSWILAERTARPNLSAKTVVFEHGPVSPVRG